MKKKKIVLIIAVTTAFVALSLYAEQKHKQSTAPADAVVNHSEELVAQGRQIFRFDTFGDQDFWGGALQLHKALEGASTEE
jgi:hypothetical protein